MFKLNLRNFKLLLIAYIISVILINLCMIYIVDSQKTINQFNKV
jgi:hypothetical protein